MGFAGQVFAARVAVGLAMPSPKAFSQAGSMIGGFASKMYASLNQKGTQAAKKNLQSAQQNLANAKTKLEAHSKTQQKFLEAGARASVARLQGAYKDLGKTSLAGAGAMKGMKAKMGKTAAGVKLFKNLSKDLKDAKDYEKMMINFAQLSKAERNEIMLTMEAGQLKLKNKISDMKTSGKYTKDEIQLVRDERNENQLHLDEFRLAVKTRGADMDKFNKEHKQHSKDYTKAEDEVQAALKETTEVNKDAIKVQEHFTQAASGFVIEMQTGFVEALRESISLLSAFYYKLNQNTQELIEFERELMNANSVFQVTRDELFLTGDTVVQFGQQFGLEMQNGATGLYQLASAGLSASDSLKVLTETLKLSMAVQGDHNTISKLVTQTLFGFDMEMDKAAEVADKFAFAIQKSLIEYQDLASAVKFALPFFTTTGQSIDQLLGALQILTNRALEAGIAGRGLRQGLAELAESIGDNTARFREFGIEVTDSQGNMLKLTEIAANFSEVLSAGVINDTELLTTLIEDLNVRGATAFVHLVQASDEFTQAVEDTRNAGGQLDEMVRIQNESIGAQIQILKNNVAMMFMYRDATYEGTIYLNAFHEAMVKGVGSLRDILVVQRDGVAVLTEFGLAIQKVAITGVKEMEKILANALPLLEKFVQLGALGIEIFKIYLIPLKLVLAILDKLGPTFVKYVLTFHLLNKLLPISTALNFAYLLVKQREALLDEKAILTTMRRTNVTKGYSAAVLVATAWQKLRNRENANAIVFELEYTATTVAATAATKRKTKSQIEGMAAYKYMSFLKTVGITVDNAEITTMNKSIFLGKLKKKGLIENGVAYKGLRVQKTLDLLADNAAIASQQHMLGGMARKRGALLADSIALELNTATEVKNIAATNVQTLSLRQRSLAYWQGVHATLADTWTTIKSTVVDWLKSFSTHHLTLAEQAKNTTKSAGILLTIRSIIYEVMSVMWTEHAAFARWKQNYAEGAGIVTKLGLFIANVALVAITIVVTVVTLAAALAMWLLTAPILIITSPIFLFVAGCILLAGALAWVAIRINQQIDIMWVFMQVLTGVKNFFVALGHELVRPFIWLGNIIYEVMEVHLFKFILFIKHLFMMLSYYIFAFIDIFKGNDVGSTMAQVLMAPFNALKGAILFAVGVLFTNDDSLFNSLKRLFGWMISTFKVKEIFEGIVAVVTGLINVYKELWGYLDSKFKLKEKFHIALDAAKAFWGWIREKMTWDSIKGMFGKIGKGIVNLWLAPLRAVEFVWNKLIDTISGKGFKVWNPVPGDNDFKLKIPNLSKWKLRLSDAIASKIGMAEGGYIQQMAQGGRTGRFPVLVGEKGPEMFMPKRSGRIIPTKDLSSRRVRDMLRAAFTDGKPGIGADKIIRVQQMTVGTLNSGKTRMNKTRMGVDTFA